MNKSDTTQAPVDELVLRLVREKEVANKYQERRHEQWNDNYTLYRNKVKINRLTQRQSVNVPLMKETIKTLQAKIDEPPIISWKELSGDQEKEIILQEKWNDEQERLNFDGIDAQDKKLVLLYGRSFKKLNFVDGKFAINALDIYDVVIDPLVDPLDIETARYIVHQNIFRSLRDVIADKRYDAKAKTDLKTFLASDEAIIQAGKNKEELEKKQERLRIMGVDKKEFEDFGAGDVIVNLTEQYFSLWDDKKKEYTRYVAVYANDNVKLLQISLKDALGVDFYPFVSWGEDVETQDIWSDGPADLVRTPNKILNVWFSQMIENRTLKNFQMHWFDATNKKFQPQTYEPGPGRMLPAPGNPNEVIKPVEISGLDDTLQQIDFLIKLIERGTGATAIDKGVSEKKQITLGEVEMLVGKASERIIGMSKFYRRAWEELAMKWYQIVNANTAENETCKLYKTSSKGVIWVKKITAKDWKSPNGFKPVAQSVSEEDTEKTKEIQRLFFLKQQFPMNEALAKIVQKRSLTLIDLSSEEIREIEEAEKKVKEQVKQMPEQQSGLFKGKKEQSQEQSQESSEDQKLQSQAKEIQNLII